MADEITDSALTVAFDFAAQNSGDAVSDATMAEVVRRLTGTVELEASNGGTIVSKTAPVDTTLIWFLADENGVPTGEGFAFNSSSGNWESTDQVIPQYFSCVSESSSNLLKLDAAGCLLVDSDEVRALISSQALGISVDATNILRLGSDGFLFGDPTEVLVSADAGNALTAGTDGLHFLDVASLSAISADAGNNLTLGADLRPFYGEPSPSADAGNEIVTGTDGKLYVPTGGTAPVPSSDVGNVLVIGTDSKLFVPTPPTANPSADAGNALINAPGDGLLYAPVAPSKTYGELYDHYLGTSTIAVAASGTFYEVPLTQSGANNGVTLDAVNGRIEADDTGIYMVQASTTVDVPDITQVVLTIAKNGTAQNNLLAKSNQPAIGQESISWGGIISLTSGDHVSIWLKNDTDTDDIKVLYTNLHLIRIA